MEYKLSNMFLASKTSGPSSRIDTHTPPPCNPSAELKVLALAVVMLYLDLRAQSDFLATQGQDTASPAAFEGIIHWAPSFQTGLAARNTSRGVAGGPRTTWEAPPSWYHGIDSARGVIVLEPLLIKRWETCLGCICCQPSR